MELRVLNYFLMAAREENITKAAAILHVTQPTLSRQLMQLEEELGVRLFDRSSHNIVLTEDGMLLRRLRGRNYRTCGKDEKRADTRGGVYRRRNLNRVRRNKKHGVSVAEND